MLTKVFFGPGSGYGVAASLPVRQAGLRLSSRRHGRTFVRHAPLLLFFFAACNNQPHPPRTVAPAFYYWKSAYRTTAFEKNTLDSLHVNTLYIKFFDVDWDGLTRQPVPKAVVRFDGLPNCTLIPTVFITNETLQQATEAQAAELPGKIIKLVTAIQEKYGLPAPAELQIDCDWSVSTKTKYFALLRALKKNWPAIPLSATIRLYQTKYPDKAGVPPVDRGLLMCYNMGNLKNMASDNSIIETAELEKYIGNLGSYPLPLDVALPIFGWKVWFRKDQYKGITQELPDSLLQSPVFAQNGNRYTVLLDTTLNGHALQKGDVLRLENSAYPVVAAVAKSVSQKLKNTQCRVSLYHLDSVLLSKYSLHELESLFDGLR
jgi:hypothetical protein